MKALYVFLLALLVTFHGTAENDKGQIVFENTLLKEQHDSLHISFNLYLHSSAVKDCQALLITPILETSDNIRKFPYIQINGNNRQHMLDRWEVTRGRKQQYERPYMLKTAKADLSENVTYTFSTPYEQWMDSAKFSVHEEWWDCAGEKRIHIFSFPDKVEPESKIPYQPNPLVIYLMPPAEEKHRNVQGKAYLDFQVGKSVILPTYRRNPEELAKIKETINEVKNNPDVKISGLYIEGYASPEGSYATNDRLSREWANALKEYIHTTFAIPQDRFTVTSVAEDWDGLRILIEQSNIAQKERILSIIDSKEEYDRKEQQLKALGAAYRTISNEMFPQLRRVEYQVDYQVKEYTTNEAKNLIGKNPEHLSQQELFLLARTYPENSTDFNKIIETASRLYPDDPVANLNNAAILLKRGEYTTAKRFLDKAGNTPDTYNNWGVYYLHTGELEKAEEYFTKAAEAGQTEAHHNLREVERKKKDNQRMERYNNRQ
ncbi:MAG: DUF3868 domain-containing protein [Candidatus Azobacteroides sp.]|nr:DUF3868 domain-containing protein [Candidatus Azobacteroides sp.]